MVGLARGEPRGGGACRQSDRSSWGGVAGTESRKDGAADVTGPQLYAACIGGSWRCERVLANAGGAWMVCVAGGVVGRRAVAGGWGLRGASRGAAVHADNWIGDDGAASLAPSLGRMTQLTSLHLSCTLRASAAAGAVSEACEPGCAWMVCVAGGVVGRRAVAGGWGLARGEPRGGGACRQSDRRQWGGIVEVECPSDLRCKSVGETFASCFQCRR